MKTYLLTVPDAAKEGAVQAALVELLARHLIVLEPEASRLFDPVSEEAFTDELRAALQSPVLSGSAPTPNQWVAELRRAEASGETTLTKEEAKARFSPQVSQELNDRITEAERQPRLSFAEARQRLGL